MYLSAFLYSFSCWSFGQPAVQISSTLSRIRADDPDPVGDPYYFGPWDPNFQIWSRLDSAFSPGSEYFYLPFKGFWTPCRIYKFFFTKFIDHYFPFYKQIFRNNVIVNNNNSNCWRDPQMRREGRTCSFQRQCCGYGRISQAPGSVFQDQDADFFMALVLFLLIRSGSSTPLLEAVVRIRILTTVARSSGEDPDPQHRC